MILPDRLDQVARVFVAKNGTTVQGRREINLIEGSNIGVTAADDAINEQVDVTFAAADPFTNKLTPPAGTTAAGTAPLKFAAGPLLTTVEEGAMEFKGHTLYMTTFQVRRSVVLAQEVPIADSTTGVSNTTENTIYSVPMAANYLTAGKHIDINLYGIFSSVAGPNGVCTLRVKYAGATVLTFASVAALNTNVPFDININTTCRAIGSGTTGKIISWGDFTEGAATATTTRAAGTVANIDTTTLNTITITQQFAGSSADNGVTVQQGHTLCIDANT